MYYIYTYYYDVILTLKFKDHNGWVNAIATFDNLSYEGNPENI